MRRANHAMRLSARGALFIGRYEGLVLKPYNDAAGHATIGYGHLIHYGPVTAVDRARYAFFTKEKALQLLLADAEKAAACVRGCVKPKLTQPQFDALVSFAFNVGNGALEHSTLLKILNEQKTVDARVCVRIQNQLLRWNKAGGRALAGLTARRRAEGRMFATGRYR